MPGGEVDWPAVVGIDEGEVPKLGALIKVGYARRCQSQHGLRQAIYRARQGDPLDDGISSFTTARAGSRLPARTAWHAAS